MPNYCHIILNCHHNTYLLISNLPSNFITKIHIPTSFESSDKNKGDLEVGNPRFLPYIKKKTYSCTTIKLQLYDYTCYGCTTIELWLYNYRGYSRTTIEFPQRNHLVKKSQIPDYQRVSILLHICDILKETISVWKYENLRQANVKKTYSL